MEALTAPLRPGPGLPKQSLELAQEAAAQLQARPSQLAPEIEIGEGVLPLEIHGSTGPELMNRIKSLGGH